MEDMIRQNEHLKLLLANAIELLDFTKDKLAMFERQRYWELKIKINSLNILRDIDNKSNTTNYE